MSLFQAIMLNFYKIPCTDLVIINEYDKRIDWGDALLEHSFNNAAS